MDTRTRESLDVPEVAPIADYDWEAAARRRPGRNECERVILHVDQSVEARISSTRYYGREATARIPKPQVGARHQEFALRPRAVRRRTPRWRLGLLAVSFAVFLVGTGVVTPVLINSAVTGVETAVGRAEAEQAQLAAETAALEAQISSLSSPQRVAEEAAHLGLVPANEVSYLSSGTPLLASEGDTEVAGR